MISMKSVFWTVAAIDAVLLGMLFVMTLDTPSHDGGRDMAMFFFVVAPAAVLAAAMLLFAFVDAKAVRAIALFTVVVPGLVFVGNQLHEAWIDHRIADMQSGAGYFSGATLRELGKAVVRHDVATLRRLGPTTDVNTTGDDGMPLLALAVSGDGDPADIPVVQALLATGAKPDAGLDGATRRADPALLRVLLEAGANPNYTPFGQQPIVFRWLDVMTPDTLRLLVKHGLDTDGRSYGDPLAVVATIHRRWDLLVVLIAAGADVTRPRADGRNVRDELTAQAARAVEEGKPVPPDLLRATAMLARSMP